MGWSEKYKRSIDCDNPKGFSQRSHCQGKRKKLSEQLKSFKTVEQIAKKHRLEVSFIQKQLDMGEPIEHEHTKNHSLAKKIALQHLDEIPDYYTRLKKMEAQSRKDHKKFKDVKEETKSGDQGLHDWFNKSKSSDGKSGWVQLGGKFAGKPCARQPGQTSTPKCGSSKMKRALSKDEEESARRRKNRLDPNQPEKSGGAKPTNVRTEEMNLQEVKDKPGKGSGKKDACYSKVKSRYSVWPSAYASGALVKCRKVGADNWGTKSEETNMIRYCPKCKKEETREECRYGTKYWDMFSLPTRLTINQMKYNIATIHPSNEEYHIQESDWWHPDPKKDAQISGAGNKMRARENRGQDTSAQTKPDYSKRLKPGETYMQFAKRKEAERTRKEEKDHEYSMARSELSTIISAAKRLRKKMKGEGNIEAWVQSKITKAADYIDTAADYVDSGEHNESIKIEDANGKIFAEVIDIIGPDQFKPVVEAKKNGDPCWVGYKQVGMKKKGGKMVPNCVKESFTIDKDAHNKLKRREKIRTLANVGVGGERDVAKNKLGKTAELPSVKKEEKTFSQFMEDWQKVNKSDKTDGMSPAAVKAYRRENPGSKLKTAVTGDPKPGSKDAKRRKSFCSRSKGQQDMHNIDCSKTPDKAICKARRRWKC